MGPQSRRKIDGFALDLRMVGLLGLWLLAGCAGGLSGPPGWVNGEPPAEYPRDRYVSAIGTGTTLEDARVAAKAELSRVFSAQLRSQIDMIEESITGDERVVREQTSLMVDTTISTDIDLQGVEVPLHWLDSKTGSTWAYAVLERRTECLRLRSEGGDLITRMDGLVADTDAQTNPLAAIRSAVQAARVGVELDGLQARSRVVGSQCLPARSTSTGAAMARVDSARNALRFVVNARDIDAASGRSNGPLPQLRERIAGNLTQRGFKVGAADGKQVIPIEAWLRLSRVERGTEWVEYRWEGAAEISSPVAGDPSIVAATSEGAESHPEASTARLRPETPIGKR
jgi:hypothetical protein